MGRRGAGGGPVMERWRRGNGATIIILVGREERVVEDDDEEVAYAEAAEVERGHPLFYMAGGDDG